MRLFCEWSIVLSEWASKPELPFQKVLHLLAGILCACECAQYDKSEFYSILIIIDAPMQNLFSSLIDGNVRWCWPTELLNSGTSDELFMCLRFKRGKW